MEVLYFFFGNITMYILYTIWLMVLLSQIGYQIYRYVLDKDDHKKVLISKYLPTGKFFEEYETNLFYITMVLTAVLIFVAGFAWPLVFTVGMVYVILRALRYFFRFKKKVTNMLGRKSNKGHTH